MGKNFLFGLLMGGVLVLLRGADPTPDQRERIQKLENSILAPCCYSEVVARHNSEVAVKMQIEITAWVTGGLSDREILDAYKKRYGLRVLRKPEGPAWWWSNIVPWFALSVGAFLAVRILRKWRGASQPTPAVTSEQAIPIPDLDDQ
jgi:cytochrome c-type biogenesis protein CcmH/NrfF